MGDFSGSPEVKNPHSQCRGHKFDLWLEKILHGMWHGHRWDCLGLQCKWLYFFFHVLLRTVILTDKGQVFMFAWHSDYRREHLIIICTRGREVKGLPDSNDAICYTGKGADRQLWVWVPSVALLSYNAGKHWCLCCGAVVPYPLDFTVIKNGKYATEALTSQSGLSPVRTVDFICLFNTASLNEPCEDGK